MTRRAWIAGVGLAVMVGAGAGLAIASDASSPPSGTAVPVSTASVDRGRLADTVSLDGTLAYRGRADGSPYPLVNQARGIYTALPGAGDRIACGDELDRVDDRPVLLLCGTVPAYRDLHIGDRGRDVEQLNANLHRLGYDRRASVAVSQTARTFGWTTLRALEALQRAKGLEADGALGLGEVVFLAEPARVAKVGAQLGGPARPGSVVAQASGTTLHIEVELAPSQQRAVRQGDRARISLPGHRSATGTVDRLGRVAQVPTGPDHTSADATISAFIGLDDPAKARGLDAAPVQVQIATAGVTDALSVPVTALVGKPGGGFAVDVMHRGGSRVQVAVEVGLLDSTAGRVQVEGALHEGDRVVVPSL